MLAQTSGFPSQCTARRAIILHNIPQHRNRHGGRDSATSGRQVISSLRDPTPVGSLQGLQRRELESLISTLQHACRVIKPNSFLRIIDLLRIPWQPHHHVSLNKLFRADLQWWAGGDYLGWGDVAVNPARTPSKVRVILKQSKTDHFGCGVSIFLGATGDDLCPIAVIMRYAAL